MILHRVIQLNSPVNHQKVQILGYSCGGVHQLFFVKYSPEHVDPNIKGLKITKTQTFIPL